MEDRPDVAVGSYYETTESNTGWAEAVLDSVDNKKKWRPRPAPNPPLPPLYLPSVPSPPLPPLPAGTG